MQNMSSRYKLTNVPGQTHSPHFDVFFATFVYEVPSWQSVPRLKRIKTEFDAYLNSATKNLYVVCPLYEEY